MCVPAADLRSDYGQIRCVLLKQLDPLLDLFQKPVDLLHGDREVKLFSMRSWLAFSTAPRFYSGSIRARYVTSRGLRHVVSPARYWADVLQRFAYVAPQRP